MNILSLENEISLYLKSIRKLYPSGIPISLLDENKKDIQSKITSSILFVGDKKDSEGNKLLSAAITKGMKIDNAEVCYLDHNMDKFQHSVKENHPDVLVILGEGARSKMEKITQQEILPGQWCSWNNIDIFTTLDPADVAKNINLKKPFWIDLQKVMRKIGI